MTDGSDASSSVVALAGGVGGAKLAHGLTLTGLGDRLSVVVNTGDDFTLYGLHISPDLDTVLYTLGGVANPETGWGVAGDTFNSLEMLGKYGQDIWFWLGDRDIATHILRTAALHQGRTLTDIMAELATALDIEARILPMCDEPVATLVDTPAGELEFQEYFVRRQHSDEVRGLRFAGIDQASVTPETAQAIDTASAIIICPSNPFVSVDPILNVPGMRERLTAAGAPIVAVSPIVGGEAIKGPAADMLRSLGHEVSAYGVAEYYRDFIDGIVIDERDTDLAGRIEQLGLDVEVIDTIMIDDQTRRQLAEHSLALAERISQERG